MDNISGIHVMTITEHIEILHKRAAKMENHILNIQKRMADHSAFFATLIDSVAAIEERIGCDSQCLELKKFLVCQTYV